MGNAQERTDNGNGEANTAGGFLKGAPRYIQYVDTKKKIHTFIHVRNFHSFPGDRRSAISEMILRYERAPNLNTIQLKYQKEEIERGWWWCWGGGLTERERERKSSV